MVPIRYCHHWLWKYGSMDTGTVYLQISGHFEWLFTITVTEHIPFHSSLNYCPLHIACAREEIQSSTCFPVASECLYPAFLSRTIALNSHAERSGRKVVCPSLNSITTYFPVRLSRTPVSQLHSRTYRSPAQPRIPPPAIFY